MTPTLAALRRCFDGAAPAVIATCAADGTPNVANLSQVHYVDEGHVALSYQFFNTTRKNILANPRATIQVVDPDCAALYRLQIEYLRTETAGPLFEYMKAKLAGIASHTGMSRVFRLKGADVYRVLAVDHVWGGPPAGAPSQRLAGLRACLAGLGGCGDLAELFDGALAGLERYCGIAHAMLLMHDERSGRLYTVASRGYRESGVGFEVAVGEGIIGVAARERIPIRIGYAAPEYLYSRIIRRAFGECGGADALETEIPFPGLADSSSQLAVPLALGDRLLGVLYAESPQDEHFTCEDEDALAVLCGQLALSIELLSQGAEQQDETAPAAGPAAAASGPAVEVRHYEADRSVFVDNEYLIKGVAGAILWKLLRDNAETGRSEFSNRELRLDPSLRLPDFSDNLEARLILLQRRLAERCPHLSIVKTGRGRFRLEVSRPLRLVNEPAG